MKVSVENLQVLFERYHQTLLNIYLFGDILVKGRVFKSGDAIRKDDVVYFKNCNVSKIEILCQEKIYTILSEEFPAEYRKPSGAVNYLQMDKHLENLQNVNLQSRRKRFLYVIGDYYGIDHSNGKRIIALTHNEKMDYRKWSSMRRYIDKEQKFPYRNSESAIILFVNMTPDAEGNYVERFKKNTDMVAALVTRKKDSNITISPDFVPTEDVITVNNPAQLFDVYRESDARLIIIGETLSDSYRESLLKVKQFDKYVRIMVVPSIDTKNLNHFLTQVKLVYNSNRWEL